MAHDSGGKQQRKASSRDKAPAPLAPEAQQPAVAPFEPLQQDQVVDAGATPNLDAASQEVYGQPLGAQGAVDTSWSAAMTDFYANGTYEPGTPLIQQEEGEGQATAEPPHGPDVQDADAVGLGHTAVDMGPLFSLEAEPEGYEDGDAGASATASASLLDNGMTGDLDARAAVDSSNGEGMTSGASVALGGGISAVCDLVPTDDPATSRITVTIRAKASLGADAEFEQQANDQQTGFVGGLGITAAFDGEWTTSELVGGPTAQLVASAWSAGDYVNALRSLASVMAILERLGSGQAMSVGTDGLAPGELRTSSTSIEGALCIPASWGVASIEVGVGGKATAERTIQMTADRIYQVRVGFSGTTVLKASGDLNLEGIELYAGIETEVSAGLILEYHLHEGEKPFADQLLAVSDRRGLERLAGSIPVPPHSQTLMDGNSVDANYGLGKGDFSVGWDARSQRQDHIVTGHDGMDGTAIHGEAADGFGVRHDGDTVLGYSDHASIDAQVDGGEMTARIEAADETAELGLGWPSLDSVWQRNWPEAFKGAFVTQHSRLTATILSDADIRSIVMSRVYDEANWEACAKTPATHGDWCETGAAMRASKAPADWTAADPNVAPLVARMQILADFVARHGGDANHILHNLTQRFGCPLEFEDLGSLDSWPAGTEGFYNLWVELRDDIEGIEQRLAELAELGKTAEGMQLVTSLEVSLRIVQQGVIQTPTPEAEAQTLIIDELGEALVELGYQAEIFALSSEGVDGECLEIADGQHAELRALIETMRGYQVVERGIAERYRGSADLSALIDFQAELGPLYARWFEASCRTERLSGSIIEPRPDFENTRSAWKSLRAHTSHSQNLEDIWPRYASTWSWE